MSPDQQRRLESRFDRHKFASIDASIRQLLDGRITERIIEGGDDLAWAKSHLDAARADIASGRVMSREEHRARMDALEASLKG